MESSGQNRNLQGISTQIVNLALQNGIIPSSLSAVSLPAATLDVACSSQTPSTSFSAIVPTQPLNVPFFESETFKNVNLNVAPSSLLNGLDLPTDDVTTLRFFYNLGVQALRNYQCMTNSSALPQVAQCVSTAANQIPLGALQNEQQAQMLREYRERQLASQQAIRDLQSQLLKNSEIPPTPTTSHQLSLLYQSHTVPTATAQPDSLLLQNSLMNSNVDWLAFNELVVRARMFTAALDMVPSVQNEAYSSQSISSENASSGQNLKIYDHPATSLASSDAVSANFARLQNRLTPSRAKSSEELPKQGSQAVKATEEEPPSPIAQPLPIRPKPNNHEAIYDMQVSHSLLAASEMHYDETFKNSQSCTKNYNGFEATTAAQHSSTGSESVSSAEQESQVSPQLLIYLINTYLSKLKKQLYNKGVGLHLDSQGLPIDFSARPVDPIFRNAREQLDSIREYRDTGTPLPNHIAVDLNRRSSPSLKEAEIVESATERLQQSAFRERDAFGGHCAESTKPNTSDKSETQSAAVDATSAESGKEVEGKSSVRLSSNLGNIPENKSRCVEQDSNVYVPVEKRKRTNSSGN